MTGINFTDRWVGLDSELVWNVWYDAPTAAAYVDLQGHVYRYDNVTLDAVKELVEASSIGRAFNGNFLYANKGFKRTYGPGKYLGNRDSIDKNVRVADHASGYVTTLTHDGRISMNPTTATVGTPKGLTYAPDATVDGVRVDLKADENDSEPVRIPLRSEPEAALAASKFTVHFLSNGEKTYSVEAGSVEDAIAELNKAAEMLGVRVKVTGVFHHFE